MIATKYRGLRAHGFDPVCAALLACFSWVMGQPRHEVSILNVTFVTFSPRTEGETP